MLAENELLQHPGFTSAAELTALPALRVVQPDGQANEELLSRVSDEELIAMYQQMLRVRLFDRKCIALQRQGKMGTYAPFEGQEAAQVASAVCLANKDWMFPTYRDHAAAMTRGLPMQTVYRYWMGQMDGFSVPDELNILPPCVPIATHLLHGVGAAWAARLRDEDTVSFCYFGDGATSEGDFHEALNFAGVFHLPVVFFCQNNGFAISVPFARQSASPTIAKRASAYGMDGIRVDGNDAVAVYLACQTAIHKARNGGGPTLIEAVTQRFGAHTTADDPTRYRDQAAMNEEWRRERDAVQRLRLLLTSKGLWDDNREEQWIAKVGNELVNAWEEAVAMPFSEPIEMFDHVYSKMPAHLEEQKKLLAGGGLA
ncbi:pyruvate dehydrogenase E1 component alpha subunit [Alicyclobacillus tengchongensis]|uniref:Pyruvate dehydrogenase E1 component subunit alpha n=1 Tax=Alicyclobacillus tolerans TaxID=90970 RepID=A0ABT9LTS9_9BACL|nr:pyruvate dehydrogenase (acetyl-transferring) E1 component subunit alpha [Alicyclobacillus tengchongensis]MDP9727666.1 pyruvate dehydrogenase E1 component alpha subunit [Alicyclobacillus tengchongensis]